MELNKNINVNFKAFKALHDYLVVNKDHIEKHLDMESYVSTYARVIDWHTSAVNGIESCKTSACLAGWGATSNHKCLAPHSDERDWNTYINRVYFNGDSCYIEEDNEVFGFIFDGEWPNDIDQSIARLKFLIKNKAIPELFSQAMSTY